MIQRIEDIHQPLESAKLDMGDMLEGPSEMEKQVLIWIKACQLLVAQEKDPSDQGQRAVWATEGMIEDFQKELKWIRSI
jgi:hypothetical protein